MADPNESSPPAPPYGYGYPTTDPTGSRTLRDYWRILVQRRWVIYTCLIAVVSVTMILTFFTTPIYEAVTTIQIERQGPDILTFKDVVSADPSSLAYQDFYQTQYRILQSRSVVKIAAERLDLATRPEFVNRKPSVLGRAKRAVFGVFTSMDKRPASMDPNEAAIAFVQGNLSVRPLRNSQLVAIAFRDRDPALAREIANVLAEAYVEFNYRNKYGTTELAREFLTKEVAQAQAEIAGLQHKLQEYGDSKKILAVSEGSQDISEQALADFNRRYVEAKTRYAAAQARFDNAVGAAPESLPEVLNSPLIANLKQQYAEVERKYSQMAERFKEGWPPLMQLRQELEQARLRLDTETRQIATQVQSVAQADYERSQREMGNLEREVNRQKGEVQRVNRDTIEYAGLQSEIESKRKILSDLAARQSQTSASERLKDTTASNIRIVDQAELPEHPVKPNRRLNLALSILVAGALGVGMALLLDHLDNTIKSEKDIQRFANLPVLGYLPFVPSLRAVPGNGGQGSDSNLLDLSSHLEPRGPFAEAFKNLRTSIMLASPSRPPRTLTVTSCEPQEGKSTVSINLAIVLTQLGRRVLLVDADLRRPRVHRPFRLDNTSGLSSYLSGNVGLGEIIQGTEIPNLSVVPSGPIPPNPSELLGSPLLTELIAASEQLGFDHVILDSPPVLSVTDPVLLATHSDTTILVIHSMRTKRENLAAVAARLRQGRLRLPGTVLNAVTADAADYYYGGYKYYYQQEQDSPSARPLRSRRRIRAARN